jgi:hypothetical protein
MKPRNLVFRVCFVIGWTAAYVLIISIPDIRLAVALAMAAGAIAAASWFAWHLLSE